MPVVSRTQKAASVLDTGAELLKKHWIVFLPLIFLWPQIKRYFDRQKEKTEEQNQEQALEKVVKTTTTKIETEKAQNNDPVLLQERLNKITKVPQFQTAARNIAFHLGTDYDGQESKKWTKWFTPSYWTENDTAAADEVIKYRSNYKYVKWCYEVIVPGTTLGGDLKKYLDADQLARVKKYINI